MTQNEFVVEIAKRLDQAGIPFMLTGSHSSSFHAHPRATNDVDCVIDPTGEQLESFLANLGDDYYVSHDSARDALRRRSMFNVIFLDEGFKADLIIRKDRPFSIEEFQRRQIADIHGYSMPIATSEDIILAKLEWNRITPSERQLGDVKSVLVARAGEIDLQYLKKWAVVLGVEDTLNELLEITNGIE